MCHRRVHSKFDPSISKVTPAGKVSPIYGSLSFDISISDLKAAQALEQRTVLQSLSKEWLDNHKFRLTANNFHKVLSRFKNTTNSFMNSIFFTSNISNVKSIEHGKVNEKIARSIYSKKMQKKVYTFFSIFDAGLNVQPTIPCFGASPDAKVLTLQQQIRVILAF